MNRSGSDDHALWTVILISKSFGIVDTETHNILDSNNIRII